MNKIIILSINDLRNILRDQFLKYFFLLVPILFILILALGIPFLEQKFPVVKDYMNIFVSFFVLELPILIGFVISFMMLDEKDEKVFTALRVMPISLFQFLFYRLFFAVFFSFVFVFLMLMFNNLYEISTFSIVVNSFLFALITPIIILIEVTFASNKVTGFTLFKGLNFIFAIPFVGFFIHSPWRTLLGIIPSYWPMNSLYNSILQNSNIGLSLISILYSLIVIIILSLIFKKKVYYF